MAMKKIKTTESEMSIHIKIDSPNLIRKEVLSLAIDTIEILKKIKSYREAKIKKLNLIKDLRKEVNDIRNLTRDMEVQNLPMDINAVENLPKFRKQRDALERIERLRETSEKRWMQTENDIRNEVSMEPRAPPMELPKTFSRTKEAPKERPKDKLEADLEALREKMARL